MDYLYDEIGEENRKKLESFLEKDLKLREELDELKKTRSLLQQMPAEHPAKDMVVVEARKRTFTEWLEEAGQLLPRTTAGKIGFAIAAGIALLLFVGSIARLHVNLSNSGFEVAMGYSPAEQPAFTQDQVQTLVNQIRQENEAIMAEYAQTMYRENQEQIQQLVRYVNRQRLNDLELIDENLDKLQQANNYRWQQTNEFLGEVIQTVNLKENEK